MAGPLPPPPTEDSNEVIPPVEEPSDEELERAITAICSKFEEEDRPTWDNLTRECRRLILMWHGFQRLAWNELARDWRTPQQLALEDVSIDPDDYGRNINIYKAYGESLIAAASASIPKVRFFPRDANNPDDIIAAKEFSKASELIQQNNAVKILLLKANYIRFNSFYVALYNYHHESEEYGVNKIPIVEQEEIETEEQTCSVCNQPVTEDDVQNGDGTINCAYCGETANVVSTPVTSTRPIVNEFDEEPKGREVIEVYSPMSVKIAPYVRKLRDSPYLLLEGEQHYSILRQAYPDRYNEINAAPDTGLYRRFSRESPYESGITSGKCTVRRWWLHPFAYNVLEGMDDIREFLNKRYPNGLLAVFIEDMLVEITDENLDEHWTITEAPTSETIISDPLGSPLAPIQVMKNDLIDLCIETVDHGIGETFADPDVLSFEAYKNTEAVPGLIFPAKAPIGKNLSDGFHQIKSATLSKEVTDLDDRLTEYGQLSVGAFPSIYGGFAEGGSKTLGEYKESKNQALQRLTIPWEEINAAWAKVMKKAVLSMKHYMKEDELMVRPSGNSFANTSVSKDGLTNGDIGHVDTEDSDQFPISWPERRDLLMQLMQLKDPTLNAAIYDPNNAGEVARTIGFQNFHVPGEKDRNKQLWEISELIKAGPLPAEADPITGKVMAIPQPTVATEEFIDDHIVHIQVIKDWAVSPEGLAVRAENPQGYLNVTAHLMQHIQYAAPAPMGEEGTEDPNKVPEEGGQ